MKRIYRFLTNMDAEAARALAICIAMFAGVAALYAASKYGLGVGDRLDPEIWFEGVADSPLALPMTIVVFTGLAFVGAPQFVLIAAAVVAFGPENGALYSWVATMVAAVPTFYLGRMSGSRVARRYGGDAVKRVSLFVGRNGFWAAFAIRNVPSAPFIVVNMGLGMSHSSFPAYYAGTALGIIPKIALIAFAGKGVMEVLLRARSWEAAAVAAVGVAIWLIGMLIARRFLKKREKRPAGADAETAAPEALKSPSIGRTRDPNPFTGKEE